MVGPLALRSDNSWSLVMGVPVVTGEERPRCETGVSGRSVGNPRLGVVEGDCGALLIKPSSMLGIGTFVGSGTLANAPPAHFCEGLCEGVTESVGAAESG